MSIERLMKEARDAREDRFLSIEREARFLVERLREYESTCQCEEATREWNGHVLPPLARLEAFLSS